MATRCKYGRISGKDRKYSDLATVVKGIWLGKALLGRIVACAARGKGVDACTSP